MLLRHGRHIASCPASPANLHVWQNVGCSIQPRHDFTGQCYGTENEYAFASLEYLLNEYLQMLNASDNLPH
ncbi:hypothetical protein RRG08_018449 [Elysia crispata]|uniref:Uncharacterized protein n=1 Tax=Elysia crispata TaxID=231223 RepID=A0AAE0YTF9_9GAST|nr:hypothetical protein RRG08_018449 [Elysia crispata]